MIIGPAVWDLRSFKLLRRCADLDNSQLVFNSTSDVIYAVGREEHDRGRSTARSFGPMPTAKAGGYQMDEGVALRRGLDGRLFS